MIACNVTTGFFVLRRCGAAPVTVCARCRRPLCPAHVAEGGLCPECAAGYGYRAHPAAALSYHRRGFYSGISTTYNDSHYYSSFDEYDRESFDPNAADNSELDSGSDSDDSVDS